MKKSFRITIDIFPTSWAFWFQVIAGVFFIDIGPFRISGGMR